MEYDSTLWNDGDVISSEKMNKLEHGVKKAHEEIASNSNQIQTNKQNITTLKEDVVAKLDKNQGVKNNGKILGIGTDGNVLPVDKPNAGAIITDVTLSESGEAADAKVVGDNINKIKDELGLNKLEPPSSEENINLEDAKIGYFYNDRGKYVSWSNSDYGYRTKIISVAEGEEFRCKCTLSGGVPVYVFSDKDLSLLSGSNEAISVFPGRQLSGNEIFDETFVIPKGVKFLTFGFIKTHPHSLVKLRGGSTPQSVKTLKERVSVCEKEVIELKENRNTVSDVVKYYMRNVLFVGDSLTAGYYYDGSKYIVAKENYPFYFSRMIDGNGTNVSESGYSAMDWYKKYNATDYSKFDTAIVWLGTNKGLTNTVEEDTTDGFSETQTGYYCRIINDMIEKNPNIRIFLGTVYAVGAGSVGNKLTTNLTINAVAQKYISNVVGVVDNDGGNLYGETSNPLYHPFAKINGDALHFGKIGNLHLAEHWLNEIKKIIENNEEKMEILFNELISQSV